MGCAAGRDGTGRAGTAGLGTGRHRAAPAPPPLLPPCPACAGAAPRVARLPYPRPAPSRPDVPPRHRRWAGGEASSTPAPASNLPFPLPGTPLSPFCLSPCPLSSFSFSPSLFPFPWPFLSPHLFPFQPFSFRIPDSFSHFSLSSVFHAHPPMQRTSLTPSPPPAMPFPSGLRTWGQPERQTLSPPNAGSPVPKRAPGTHPRSPTDPLCSPFPRTFNYFPSRFCYFLHRFLTRCACGGESGTYK